MSGDVQPRKRKDKRRKRDEDEASHGVDITKLAGDDVLLHVHENHGTGGHWCAKVFFFALLTVLLGLIALIVLESRGASDLDTPLSESRFSNYFDGWVDESRPAHDEHDAIQASMEEHDDHDEPFEEEEDVSEGDEHEEHDDEEDDEENGHDHEEAEENDEDDNEEEEEDEEEEVKEQTKEANTAEVTQEKDDEDDDDDVEVDNEQDNDDEDENENEDEDNTTKERRQTVEEDENDDDEDEQKTGEENDNAANDDEEDENAENDNDDNEDNNAEDNDDDDDAVEEPIKPSYTRSSQQQSKPISAVDEDDEDEDPFDEEDDDGTFESLEPVVVDNDAEELLLLQEKARQQAEEAGKNQPPNDADDEDEEVATASSWVTSLAVKIGVGVALALVARLVLIRKNPNTMDEPTPEILMKRRLTIANAEDTYPEDEEPPLLDDELSGEEVEIEEEEIEYIEEEEEIEIEVDDNGDEIPSLDGYIPETFEQLNEMYRSATEVPTRNGKNEKSAYKPIERSYQPLSSVRTTSKKASPVFVAPPPPPVKTSAPPQTQATPSTSASTSASASTKTFNTNPSTSSQSTTFTPAPAPTLESTPSKSPSDSRGTTAEVTHDLDYQPDEDDIDYDDDEIYEEEEEAEDEELDMHLVDDEADVSDVDDSELMNRLEAKYGRLPTKEYESDEDPDDPSWTQIKPKQTPGAGPQAVDTDDEADSFDKELRRANEEMMRENYLVASQAFSLLTQKYADKPQVFLAYAKTLDKLSQQQQSTKMLEQTLEAYKRYLAFDELIEDDTEYRAVAERCIKHMRSLAYHSQAIVPHEQLIARFPDEPQLRNDLAETYLLVNRLAEAKLVLQQTLQRWPMNGFTQVLYGFVLSRLDRDYENAVVYLQAGIRSEAEETQHGRFYIDLGDALQRLGRRQEALKIYERGAALKLFPSIYQRSQFNVPHLKARPYWTKNEATYGAFFEKLEQNWLAIRAEGLSVLSKDGYFVDEGENLLDTGDWKQLVLFWRAQRYEKNCQKAPITCGLVERFTAASRCLTGQVKFSVMHPGTHVWPHCGPTNCRLRAHLGLVVPQGTILRVAQEERTWTEGKFLIFDDSFEHEVWHNGTDLRMVLIVDVWHPQLSEKQRRRIL